MSFHNYQNTSGSSQDGFGNQRSIASGLLPSAQTLGSIGTPAIHSRSASNGGISGGGAGLYPSSTSTPTTNGAGSPYYSAGSSSAQFLTPTGAQSLTNTPLTSTNTQSYFETQRPATYRRASDESRIQSMKNPAADMSQYSMPSSYAANETLPYHLQPQMTAQQPQPPASANIPGTGASGNMGRPVMNSINSAPGPLSSLPQISTQLQEPTTPTRPTAGSHSHSYSRSSPAGLDQQKYKTYTNAGEPPRIAPPMNFATQPPPSASAYSQSPLVLGDIRSDMPQSPGVWAHNGDSMFPSVSNHISPWPIYALDWCKWPVRQNSVDAGKIAIGSYLEDSHNYIHILDTQKSQPDPDNIHAESGLEFVKTAEATHSYPVTRILWEPPSSNKQTTDLLATSGDHLRLWSLPADQQSNHSSYITRSPNPDKTPLQKLAPLALLSNSKSPEHTAPITSLDWNIVSPSLIITSSIDTTCTIWDIPTLTAKTQLIAHDKEVFDVRFCAQSVDVFVSCGADGSVRMFDLRSLEHSTIIYEPSDKTERPALPSSGTSSPGTSAATAFPPPLLRIAASPHDAHLLATFSQDSPVIRVLDVRQPGQALLELKGHGASVNSIEWSHSHRGLLASGADDSLVMIWDLMGYAGAVSSTPTPGSSSERGPSAVWDCDYEISNLSWAPGEFGLGVVGGKSFWAVNM